MTRNKHTFNKHFRLLLCLLLLLAHNITTYAQDGGVDMSPASISFSGSALAVNTPYDLISPGSNTGKYAKDIITFSVDEETAKYIPDNFTASVTLLVYYGKNSYTENSTTQTLTISYSKDAGVKYNAKSYFSFDGAFQLRVLVQSINPSIAQLSNGVDIKEVLKLQCEMRVSQVFTLVAANKPTVADGGATADELTLNWSVPDGTGQNGYQLEWTWLEDELQGNYTSGTTVNRSLLYQNNATRVDLPVNVTTYNIPLLYDGVGKLYYRVRAINANANGTRADGAWSDADDDYYSFQGHNNDLNWQATTSYAEGGKRKSVVQYFDGSLRSRQTVTKDNVNNNTVIAETFYDGIGRPAVQVLPVPGMNNIIAYTASLNVFNGQTGLDPTPSFDLVSTTTPSNAVPPLDETLSAAAKYYSANNTDGDPGIPKADGYPYTVTRYTPDASGRILSQSGAGAALQMGSGHETKYYYGSPAQEELDGLFGNEAGEFSHYFKNMVQDANGQMSVSYVDMHGRTVATALAGEAPSNLTALNLNETDYPNQADNTLNRNLLSSNTNITKGDAIESINGILVPYATSYTFHYNLTPQALQLVSCTGTPLSYDCMYNLEISITDDSGEKPAIVRQFNNIKLNADDDPATPVTTFENNTTSSIDFSEILQQGSYTVRKTLTLSEASLQAYRDLYLTKGLCKTQQQLIDSVYSVMQTSTGCNNPAPVITCQSCMDALGTYAAYKSRYLANMDTVKVPEAQIQAAYSADSAACTMFCTTTSQELPTIRKMMLADMMPYTGQYARETPLTGSTMYNRYDIFSTAWSSALQPFYKKPFNAASVLDYYYDVNGNRDLSIHPDSTQPYQLLNATSQDGFANSFNTAWATALLPHHPEYQKLVWAEKNLKSSYDWMETFNQVNTYSDAASAGYLFTNTTTIASVPDPYFASVSGNSGKWDTMKALIGTGGYYGASLWQLAYSQVMCMSGDDVTGITNCFNSAPKQPSLGSGLTTGQQDQIWNKFKALYATVRDSMMMAQLNAQFLTGDTASKLIAQGYQLRFASASQQALQAGATTLYTATTGGSVNLNLADSAAAVYNGRCSSYIQQWRSQLLQCGTIAAMDSATRETVLNLITSGMEAVCQKGTDAANPYGSSSVAPATPYDGTPRTFEEVIYKVFDQYHISHDLYCNAYSITSPRPYSLGPVISKSYVSLLDTCTCSQFAKVTQQAAQAGVNTSQLSSLNLYLKQVYNDTLTADVFASLQHCSELVVTCSGGVATRSTTTSAATSTGCRDTVLTWSLSSAQPLPQFLVCGYTASTSCYTCSMISGLITQFKDSFNAPYNNAPVIAATVDSNQSAYNNLLARFLNYRTGLQLTWADYMRAASGDSCDLTKYASNGGATQTVICRPTTTLTDTAGAFASVLPCQATLNMATAMATTIYETRMEKLLADFEAAYRAQCLAAQEAFTVTYINKEYHYTLYYYDMAGNLIKTVPPKGVRPDFSSGFISSVENVRVNGGDPITPNHLFVTQYRYNSLNQVVFQYTPDAHQSQFWYDKLGRLAVSSNAQQANDGKFSYTLYDDLGRITEVGQKSQTPGSMQQSVSQDPAALNSWLITTGGARDQLTCTVYDAEYISTDHFAEMNFVQENLRNRVSYSYTKKLSTDANWNTGTYYTYDIHGNVYSLMQDYSGILGTENGDRYKMINYQYDLISGKVNSVDYQPGFPDAFYHRYTYDAENRLTDVETSRDKILWERDAAYTYYKHGPLERLVLGQQQVQGIDYTYTLQGWLKGVNAVYSVGSSGNDGSGGCPAGSAPDDLVVTNRVNNTPAQYTGRSSITFDPEFDSGDGADFETVIDATLTACQSASGSGLTFDETSPVARDAYQYSLNYFTGDYASIKSTSSTTGILDALASNAASLYNGNIAAMAVNVPKLGDAKVYNYHYDQLNRLLTMDAYNGLNVANGTFAPVRIDDYKEVATYDPNGNIVTYLRNGTAAGGKLTPMDDMHYDYWANTNQLKHIKDDAPAANYTEDIDDQANTENYVYDLSGNLIMDNTAGATLSVNWTVYGKIDNIVKNGNSISYVYDASGNRVSKTADGKITIYVRDASGNVMGVYEKTTGSLVQVESDMYGSSRLGLQRALTSVPQTVGLANGFGSGLISTFTRGEKLFELSNHLGNVLTTVSDKRIQNSSDGGTVGYYTADVASAQDYYPFGMLQPGRIYNVSGYRYGFNGKENDNEVKGEGNSVDFGDRVYDSRAARWLSVDPLQKSYAGLSPYSFVANNPIMFIDPDGRKIKLAGTVETQNALVAKLQFLTGLDLQLKNGEIVLASTKMDYTVSNVLKDQVLKLIDEKQKSYKNNVVLNLVRKKESFKSPFYDNEKQNSDNTFFDAFLTGAVDMDDFDKVVNNALYAALMAHVLAERGAVSNNDYEDYLNSINTSSFKSLSDITKAQINKEVNETHNNGIKIESEVLNEFLEYPDGRRPSVGYRIELFKDDGETIYRMLKGKDPGETMIKFVYGQNLIANIEHEVDHQNKVIKADVKIVNPSIHSTNGAIDKL